MPPSAMITWPVFAASAAQSTIAVICGTPTPATMRVVQIDPGPMPTFTASAPASISARVPAAVATLPATTWHRRRMGLQPRDRLADAARMPVRGVDHHHVDARLDQRHRPLEPRVAHRRGRRHPQPPHCVLGGERVQHRLLDVLDGQEPVQPAAGIDHQQLLDPPRRHQALGLAEIGRLAQHGEIVRGHHHPHRRRVVARQSACPGW